MRCAEESRLAYGCPLEGLRILSRVGWNQGSVGPKLFTGAEAEAENLQISGKAAAQRRQLQPAGSVPNVGRKEGRKEDASDRGVMEEVLEGESDCDGNQRVIHAGHVILQL